MLELKNIYVYNTDGDEILENISAKFEKNSISLILGPNAAGKTTLAQTIAGTTDFKVKGEILFQGKDILKKESFERARMGMLLLYQNPVEIPGIKIFDFLYASYKVIVDKGICVWDFNELLEEKLAKLNLSEDFLQKDLNEGLSGGEKKKLEILQLILFKPKFAILDEIDSGLDVDAVKNIFKIVKEYQKEEKATVVLISHSKEILKLMKPDQVLLLQGKGIKERGDVKLAKKILENGYEQRIP